MLAPENLRIARRVPADDAFILSLSREAFGEYAHYAAARSLQMVVRGFTCVAHSGAKRLGFAILERPSPNFAYLAAIAVLESERGRGIGRALMQEAERRARTSGAPRLRLSTADSNLAALDLFLRLGFERTDTPGFEYPRGQRAITLEKRLLR